MMGQLALLRLESSFRGEIVALPKMLSQLRARISRKLFAFERPTLRSRETMVERNNEVELLRDLFIDSLPKL